KDKDVIRLRYCITAGSSELDQPLVNLLKSKIEEAKGIDGEKYTKDTFLALENAIQSAEAIVHDEQYNSKKADKEVRVSTEIGKLMTAVKGLVKKGNLPVSSADIPDDFENDLWLNTNFQILEVNDTYRLKSRRVPEIIDDPINNKVAHPHYNYKIIEGDSVTLQDTTDSNMTIKAVKEGTSIIEVGYDATKKHGRNYGAVSRVNKSYMIVDVVADKDADHGITLDTDIDVRSYDTVYYSEGDTVDYSFNVTATGSDKVEVTCNGNSVEGSGNRYTVPLENRGNIIGIKATKGEAREKLYYVIDARKIEMKIKNNSRPKRDIAVGDEVKVSFRGITMPVYKLATIYNPTWYDPNSQWDPTYGTTVRYNNRDLGEVVSYDNVQYELAKHNAISFTVTEEKTYRFTDGYIKCEWWGRPLGTEKNIRGPGSPDLNAPIRHDDFSMLPDFEVVVKKLVTTPVTGIEIVEEKGTVEEKATIALTGKLLPDNATEQGLNWSSGNPEVATVNQQGIVAGKKPGKATITLTSVDGNLTDTCEITVIAELPATQEEKQDLKKVIDEAKTKEQKKYSANTWKVLQEKLTEAENVFVDTTVLLAQVNAAKDELRKAINGLKLNYEEGLTVTPKVIKPGTTVTINLPQITSPNNGKPVRSLKTVYSSNIPGLGNIESNEAKNNNDLLKDITFTIPEDTPVGEYILTNGHVYKKWGGTYHPQWGWLDPPHQQDFYKGSLPEIKIKIVDGIEITEADLNQNKYDVFYYAEDEKFIIEGQQVIFISENKIQYGEKIIDFRNKKITYTVQAGGDDVVSAGETATIKFNGLKTPVGLISGKWNPQFGGEIKSIYDTDLDGLSEIRSANEKINILTLKISTDASGEYHLTNGRIFEKANPWSPGLPGIGKEGDFGRLPNITIVVEEPQNIPVTSIKLNKETVTLSVYGKDTLEATIFPDNPTDKAVTWTSCDEAIATVSSEGVVTAKSEGNTTITVTSNSDKNIKATCDVIVEKGSNIKGKPVAFMSEAQMKYGETAAKLKNKEVTNTITAGIGKEGFFGRSPNPSIARK
ncbi:MAG: Ig-like domain-containing protein, partial [Marinisporobacter sp.]|nr:Ig-like domain-containing protein [Marinisporobacter sp.]